MTTCSADVSVFVSAGVKRRHEVYVLEAEMDLAYARQKRRAIEAEYVSMPYNPECRMHVDKLMLEQERCERRLYDAKYEFDAVQRAENMLKKQRENELLLTPFHDGIDSYGLYTGSDAVYAGAVIRHLHDYEGYKWPAAEDEVFIVYAGVYAGDRLKFKYSFERDDDHAVVLVAWNTSTNRICAVKRELCVPPFCLPLGVLYDAEFDQSITVYPNYEPSDSFTPVYDPGSPKSPAYEGSPKSPAYEPVSPVYEDSTSSGPIKEKKRVRFNL